MADDPPKEEGVVPTKEESAPKEDQSTTPSIPAEILPRRYPQDRGSPVAPHNRCTRKSVR